MPRTAKPAPCKYCHEGMLSWTRIKGPRGISSRLVDAEGNIHRCDAYKQATGKTRVYAPKSEPFNTPVFAPTMEPSMPTPATIEPVATTVLSAIEQPQSEPRSYGELYKLIQADVLADIHAAVATVKQANRHITTLNVNVTRPDSTTVRIESAHKDYPALLETLRLGLNALLVGPAGSGKTHAAHDVAKAFGMENRYYPMSVGPQTSKSDLIGYMDAHGKLVRTGLREAYEHGGIFLLDEVDAGNAGVLTVLNALLANSVCSFPDHVVTKHAEFLCIAAANTFGTGANRLYVGRNQLDAATLDRFVGLDWDYDEALEARLSETQPDWCEYVWSLRKAAERTGVRRVFGTRRIMQGTRMLDAGIKLSVVKARTVFFGVPVDDKQKLEANI